MKCNDTYCQYRNVRGYCNISGCIKPKEYGNTNFKQDMIIFPFSVGDKTFYSRKELEDYILMKQNEDYGRGNWC